MPTWAAVLNLTGAEYRYSWVLDPPLRAGGYGAVDLDHRVAARGLAAGALAPVAATATDPDAVRAWQRAAAANAAAAPREHRPSLEQRVAALEAGGHQEHTYLEPTHHDALLPDPILTSPNGSHYRLTVTDAGAIGTDFVAYDPDATALDSGTGYMSESGDRLVSTTAYAFKGDPMFTEEPFTITALRTEAALEAGGVYRGLIVTGRDVVERVLAVSDPVTAAVTGYAEIVLPLRVDVPAGARIVVLTGRTDRGDGHAYAVDSYEGSRAGFNWLGIPATDIGSSCSRIASANPTVGTPINRGKGYNAAPFNVRVDWTQLA